MQRDGDVWSAIWKVMLAKGPTAINVTKVKGHATDKDVAEGRSTALHKACTNVADGLVKEATSMHGKISMTWRIGWKQGTRHTRR